jgi:hypothetical protein
MNHPKVIVAVVEGATYKIPTFKITDEGVVDGEGTTIVFAKGNKEDAGMLRQEGVFTETLLQTCKQYLESVNIGPLASRETSMAIPKIDETLMWLGKRAEDRKMREVQGTYRS